MAQYLFFFILNIFIITGLAFECPTCSKEGCKKVDIPVLKCGNNARELKYGYLKSSAEDSTLACVSLEYLIDNEIVPVRQCLHVSPTENICKDISLSLPKSIKLTNCEFELNEAMELNMIDAVDITTTPKGDISTKTPEDPSTTPGGADSNIVSFTILMTLLILVQAF